MRFITIAYKATEATVAVYKLASVALLRYIFSMDKQERENALEHMRKIGKKGGSTTALKHGRAHYATIGKKGGEGTKRRWSKLVE